jgi:hypothetical protein
MSCGFCLNLVATILLTISCFGISTDPDIIKTFPWVVGKAENAAVDYTMYVGVVGKVDQVECATIAASNVPNNGIAGKCSEILPAANFGTSSPGTYERLMLYEDVNCAEPMVSWGSLGGVETSLLQDLEEECMECMNNMVEKTSLTMGAITNVLSMVTNLQRATPFGDVNCQKFVGTIATLLGLFSTFTAMFAFMTICKSAMPDEILDYTGSTVAVAWHMGPGFACLLLASILKLVDVFLHSCLPTPRGRWYASPTPPQNVLQYMENHGDQPQLKGQDGSSMFSCCDDDDPYGSRSIGDQYGYPTTFMAVPPSTSFSYQQAAYPGAAQTMYAPQQTYTALPQTYAAAPQGYGPSGPMYQNAGPQYPMGGNYY